MKVGTRIIVTEGRHKGELGTVTIDYGDDIHAIRYDNQALNPTFGDIVNLGFGIEEYKGGAECTI